MSDNAVTGGSRRSLLTAGVILLQALVLIGIALSFYAVGWFGKDIRVRTVPVDPRDLLYGDYVTLSYDISRLDPSLWKDAARKPESGQPVYVVLKPDVDGIAQPVAAYGSKPAAQEGEVVLKGRIDNRWGEEIFVKYGVEKYYVPEGTGESLEDKASRLIVHMKVAPWGQAKIEGLEERS
ncbi:GDYXXLXY domain-containing protein [Paenibacillus sp. MZ04-78.2]|uniref:GDYXXLXY domain-containing protein n=1 Tax=Paenibacillus sp. MZ04-78.2 TaxID=2962034 RepID=UPI0020B7A903|nr:GDYXXLXY domain-containing protein [Paenibacillus sp. MZ04-78.2]MCP3773920.1 GDYXXLXY domain-containing protein [Paenibacillus sp. MZ04-78.2]